MQLTVVAVVVVAAVAVDAVMVAVMVAVMADAKPKIVAVVKKNLQVVDAAKISSF